jgi:hypothetical protein
MQLLVCEECGAASAEVLAAQGARCERCSARLAADEPDLGFEPVGGPETPPGRLRRPD